MFFFNHYLRLKIFLGSYPICKQEGGKCVYVCFGLEHRQTFFSILNDNAH